MKHEMVYSFFAARFLYKDVQKCEVRSNFSFIFFLLPPTLTLLSSDIPLLGFFEIEYVEYRG